jgi:hypothetical protein
VGDAVDRPARGAEVEEGLGDGGHAQATAARYLDSSAMVHAQRVVTPALLWRRHLGDLAHHQLAVERRRAGVTQRRPLTGGEQRGRPLGLGRRTGGTEGEHPTVLGRQQAADLHPVDVVLGEPDRAQLRRRDVPPLPRRHLRGTRLTKLGVATTFVRHAVSMPPTT